MLIKFYNDIIWSEIMLIKYYIDIIWSEIMFIIFSEDINMFWLCYVFFKTYFFWNYNIFITYRKFKSVCGVVKKVIYIQFFEFSHLNGPDWMRDGVKKSSQNPFASYFWINFKLFGSFKPHNVVRSTQNNEIFFR